VTEKRETPDSVLPADESDRRDAVRDQDELERARRHAPAQQGKDLSGAGSPPRKP